MLFPILDITYTTKADEVNAWLVSHCPVVPHQFSVLGLDVEWKPVRGGEAPTCHPPIALLQLATVYGNALLYHTCHAVPEIPHQLRRVLLDTTVFKVGVGVRDDADKIQDKWGVRAKSCIDLVEMWDLQCSVTGIMFAPRSRSLLAYGQFFVGLQNWKHRHITLSNWERHVLTPQQKLYAAMDAYVGAAIFYAMRPLQMVLQLMTDDVV